MRLLLFLIALLCQLQALAAPVDTFVRRQDSANGHMHYGIDMSSYRSLLLGAGYGRYVSGEVGYGHATMGRVGYHGSSTGVFSSVEFFAFDRSKWIIAPKVGAWAAGGPAGMTMGVHLVYYTDMQTATLRFRPDIGFGGGRVRIVTGYNFVIVNKNAPWVTPLVVSMQVTANLKKTGHDVREGTWMPDTKRLREPWAARLHTDTLFSLSRLVLLAGISRWRHDVAEIGIAGYVTERGKNNNHNIMIYMTAEAAASGIAGIKYGWWAAGRKQFGPCGGFGFSYYSNLKSNAWMVFAEGGLHYRAHRLVYGYHYALSRQSYAEITGHRLTLALGLTLRRYPEEYNF